MATSVEVEGIRNELGAQEVTTSTHQPDLIKNNPVTSIQENTSEDNPHRLSLTDRMQNLTDNIMWGTNLGFTILTQLGGLHPWRSNGKWVWVLEPWAKWRDNPNQSGNPNDSDFYFNKFKSTSNRLLSLPDVGLETPNITLDGPGGIQLLDHRRIHEAKSVNKAIVINVVDMRGMDKTFN